MRPDYTTLVLIGKGPDVWRNWLALHDAIECSGFAVAKQHSTLGSLGRNNELPLECFLEFCSPEKFTTLREAGITGLSDFTQLKAKEAWQLLLEKPDQGHLFRQVCHLFKRLGLQFTDLDPSPLCRRSSKDWRPHGIDGHTGSQLSRLGIIGEQLLVYFTPEEIGTIHGIGRKERYQKLIALREQLLS